MAQLNLTSGLVDQSYSIWQASQPLAQNQEGSLRQEQTQNHGLAGGTALAAGAIASLGLFFRRRSRVVHLMVM